MTDEKTTAADGQPDPGAPARKRPPLVLRLIAQDAFAAEECRGIAEAARLEAKDATARLNDDEEDEKAQEDLTLALAAMGGAVCEAVDAAARAMLRTAGLLSPATFDIVPAGSLMAVHAMEDAVKAGRTLHQAFTVDRAAAADAEGDDNEEGMGDDGIVPVDDIPLHDADPEAMN